MCYNNVKQMYAINNKLFFFHLYCTCTVLTMEKKLLTKKMRIPEDKKGLIIGKQFRGLKYIANVTQTNVFKHRGDNEIYVEGTVAQIKQTEKLIQEKLVRIFKHVCICTCIL